MDTRRILKEKKSLKEGNISGMTSERGEDKFIFTQTIGKDGLPGGKTQDMSMISGEVTGLGMLPQIRQGAKDSY